MNHATVNLPELVRAVVDQHRHERGPRLVILRDIQHRLDSETADVIPIGRSASPLLD